MSWIVRMIVVLPALAGLLGLLARRQRAARRGHRRRRLRPTSPCSPSSSGSRRLARPTSTSIGRPARLGGLQVPLHLLSDRLSGLVALAVALVVLAHPGLHGVVPARRPPLRPVRRHRLALRQPACCSSCSPPTSCSLLVGWEIMGWCSWLLIGHDSERPAARRAAYKAFIVTRVADIGMVVGLVALAVRARSTDLIERAHRGGHETRCSPSGSSASLIGVAGKSGLIPFHDWLPDAMEGPTPASALIHAATMVAAGSYVIARLFALYAGHDGARTLLAVLAAVTMVYAALLALAQTDLKRMLAYSTLSQIAIMLAALAAAPREHRVRRRPSRTSSVTPSSRRCSSSAPAGSRCSPARRRSPPCAAGCARRGALRWSMGLGPRRPGRSAPAHRLLHQGHRHRRRPRGRDRRRGSARLARRRRPLRHGRADRRLLRPGLAAARHAARVGRDRDSATAPDLGEPATEVPETVVVAEEDVAVVTVDRQRRRRRGRSACTPTGTRRSPWPAALSVAVLAALTVVGTLFLTSLDGRAAPRGAHRPAVRAARRRRRVSPCGPSATAAGRRRRRPGARPACARRAVRGFGADTAYARRRAGGHRGGAARRRARPRRRRRLPARDGGRGRAASAGRGSAATAACRRSASSACSSASSSSPSLGVTAWR